MPDTSTIRAFLDERHLALTGEVERFVALRVAPLPVPHGDPEGRQQARQLLALLGEEGWLGYAVPETWGGHWPEPDLRACCLIREALAAASPLADAVFALQCLGSMPITLAGSEAQRSRWLPEVARGRAMAAFAMTEPEAGSDVSSLATVAAREGDTYVLEGRKTLISNAGIADFHLVFAATNREAGSRGISCFLVAAGTPGLAFLGPQVLSAPHPLGELGFESCRVPAESRIGPEGEGFKLGMRTLDRLRPTVAAAACGMAARALAEALAHAKSRHQFGKPLAENQIVQEKLAIMATDLQAARLLVYRAAWEGDTGDIGNAGDAGGNRRISLPAAMAKAFATEAAQRIVDSALQILGGRGVLAEHPVEHLYRSVRALRIYEGTTEIQHLVIARHLLKEAIPPTPPTPPISPAWRG